MSPFHSGEIAVQQRAGVQHVAQKVGQGIGVLFPPVAREWVRHQQLLAAGGSGEDGALWATVVFGEPGFLRVEGDSTLRVSALPLAGDPVRELLENGPVSLGSITLEPEHRRRMRCNGLARVEGGSWLIEAEQVYANCPKYIQPRVALAPAEEAGIDDSRGQTLRSSHEAWIRNADTFFIATSHSGAGADCSHRGGPAGFVRVENGVLEWDDFPGNAMFNTLGNLEVNPACGLVFVDWVQSRLLQLSGEANVVWDGTERRVRFVPREWREAPANLTLSWGRVS